MALDKKTLNDFLPNGFETQNKTDYKTNFTSEQISVGYEKDTLQTLSGPNLNNLLDVTGKNFHTLNEIMTYFKNMPIGSFPIVNTSNQLDYKSVNSFFRNVGEIVPSLIPLEDENLRLLDGSLLENNITYSRFISYIAGLRSTLPNLFTTEANWQAQVQQYGECGKFVYNTTDRSLRLPKVVSYLKGTNDSSSLGDLVEAGIPQHTHNGTTESGGGSHDHGRGTMDITGAVTLTGVEGVSGRGVFYSDGSSEGRNGGHENYTRVNKVGFKASNSWTGRTTSESIAHTHAFTTGTASDNVYKSGVTTVQPQSIKIFYYIVVSIDEAEKQVLSAVYNYKGSVDTYAELPNDAAIGEVYNVIGEDPEGYSGANFAWTGEEWDRLGGTVNLSGYLTKVEAGNTYATKASLESNVDNLQEQINTNASNIANIASQEVIEQGIKKIEALKFSSTIGHGITNDTDLYSVIYNYAHSTFDRSKFTVVGSPNITDDGIASGFAGGKYLKTSNTMDFTKPWEITIAFNKPSFTTVNDSALWQITGTTMWANYLRVVANAKKIQFILQLSDETVTNLTTNNNSVNTNTDYLVITGWNGTQYYLKLYNAENNNLIQEVTVDSSLSLYNASSSYVNIGKDNNSTYYYREGSIDLKQFSITVDGVPVFSGNRTGIDTIKPNNYTVVGTPTISADGILSNCSANDYLTASNIDLTSANEVILESAVTLPTTAPTVESIAQCTLIRCGKMSLDVAYRTNNTVMIGARVPGSYANRAAIQSASCDGSTYIVQGIFTGLQTASPQYYCRAKKITENNWTQQQSAESVAALAGQASSVVNMGAFDPTGYFQYLFLYGKMGLSCTKIYVDGNLVYQPCLKIPYTLSNTDLKITRNMDRAIDMASQCGFSDYFGLNEQNNTCMVPQGDNISGRRTLVSRTEDSVTHYVTEIYSDLFCRQSGSGTANTALTFAIPYKNDDTVKVSCPYSAKSKTGFTPTANCDWFAEGYIYLDEVI